MPNATTSTAAIERDAYTQEYFDYSPELCRWALLLEREHDVEVFKAPNSGIALQCRNCSHAWGLLEPSRSSGGRYGPRFWQCPSGCNDPDYAE